jgi:hypothetical protein
VVRSCWPGRTLSVFIILLGTAGVLAGLGILPTSA